MSEYGRMWQQVEEIRRLLKDLATSIDTSSLDQAIRSTGRLSGRLLTCLAEWSELEKKMAECDDHSGERRR